MKRLTRSALDIARDEKGAVLPLMAFILVTLLVFAAFATDFGAAWAERRTDQGAADAAVMAGALNYLKGPSTSADVVDTVRDYADRNLGLPANSPDWISCVDPDRPADYTPLTDSAGNTMDCISLKQQGTSGPAAILRVRIPDRSVDTFFATVIGVDTLTVSAAAEAELGATGAGGIIPFSVPSQPAAEECLGTPPSGLLPEDSICNGPEQGNFGLLDSPLFGAGSPHNTPVCPKNNVVSFDDQVAHEIAIGLDHPVAPGDPTLPTNGQPYGSDQCPKAQNEGYVPFILNTQTGNIFPSGGGGAFPPTSFGVSRGLLGDAPTVFAPGLPGRLRQTGGLNTGPAQQRPLASIRLDNVGLWDYIVSGSGDCAPGLFAPNGGVANTRQMRKCLEDRDPVQFSQALLGSPRYAMVPVLDYQRCGNDLCSNGTKLKGSDWVHLLRFQPVYLQSTWYICKGSSYCHWETYDGELLPVFNPGAGSAAPCRDDDPACTPPQPSKIKLKGLSAWTLDGDTLPGGWDDVFGNGTPFEVEMYR